MSASKEYFLKLSEQSYEELSNDEKLYLNRLGMEVRQLPTPEDLNDENYKKIRKQKLESYHAEQKYLAQKHGIKK